MSWLGQLNLDYRRDGERTIALDRHTGPLRFLAPARAVAPGQAAVLYAGDPERGLEVLGGGFIRRAM